MPWDNLVDLTVAVLLAIAFVLICASLFVWVSRRKNGNSNADALKCDPAMVRVHELRFDEIDSTLVSLKHDLGSLNGRVSIIEPELKRASDLASDNHTRLITMGEVLARITGYLAGIDKRTKALARSSPDARELLKQEGDEDVL